MISDGEAHQPPQQPHPPETETNTTGPADESGAGGGGEEETSWTHESHGLLRPVLQFLEIDEKAWPGLEEAVAAAPARDHFLKIISGEENELSPERSKQEAALTETIDSLARKFESDPAQEKSTMKQKLENATINSSEAMHKTSDDALKPSEGLELMNHKLASERDEAFSKSDTECNEKSILGEVVVGYERRLTLIFELLSACVADAQHDDSGSPQMKKGYDARHRTALRLLATWLDIKWIKVQAMEVMVACAALAALKEEELSDNAENNTWSKLKRGGMIGAAALTGGTLMALTGGLAAPAISAGFSAIAPAVGSLVPFIGASGFAAAAGAAGSAAGSIAVAASFGAAGAGLSGYKMARRTGGVEEFEFKTIGDNHYQGILAVGVLVSGFTFEEDDFVRPWEGASGNLERYALQWESKHVIAATNSIEDWFKTKVTTELVKQGAMLTVLSTLVSALTLPSTLVSALDMIDGKWSVVIDRSDKAGLLLAEVLSKNLQGNRPVTLIGFSLGARVIFKCLQQLVESGERGVVEKVVLLGAPLPSKGKEWESVRKIVAGRFVNVFSTNDWILGVTFRASLLSHGLAGIQAVNFPGIENVDASDIIDGHSKYICATKDILQWLDLDSYHAVVLSSSGSPGVQT